MYRGRGAKRQRAVAESIVPLQPLSECELCMPCRNLLAEVDYPEGISVPASAADIILQDLACPICLDPSTDPVVLEVGTVDVQTRH
jgi:hypothetical protein